jgi:hypothetical protein
MSKFSGGYAKLSFFLLTRVGECVHILNVQNMNAWAGLTPWPDAFLNKNTYISVDYIDSVCVIGRAEPCPGGPSRVSSTFGR